MKLSFFRGGGEMSQLSDFLNEPRNLHSRERLFFNRICYDLKLASAKTSNPLQIFEPEVDRDGFDIIVDDYDFNRKIQTKTVVLPSKTASWEIHKRLLRPRYGEADALHFEHSPRGVGVGGGAIVMKVNPDNDCTIDYFYTDIYIIFALANEWVAGAGYRSQQASKYLVEMTTGVGAEKVPVPLGLFLKVTSPDYLLAIAGFHSLTDVYAWWGNMIIALENNFDVERTPKDSSVEARTSTAQAHHAIESLLKCCDEPGLRPFD
jgi:hypothetical protein